MIQMMFREKKIPGISFILNDIVNKIDCCVFLVEYLLFNNHTHGCHRFVNNIKIFYRVYM